MTRERFRFSLSPFALVLALEIALDLCGPDAGSFSSSKESRSESDPSDDDRVLSRLGSGERVCSVGSGEEAMDS